MVLKVPGAVRFYFVDDVTKVSRGFEVLEGNIMLAWEHHVNNQKAQRHTKSLSISCQVSSTTGGVRRRGDRKSVV